MSVPFENIGPGQSARLAWQVIGQDGPVSNPQRIRYLPPDALSGRSCTPIGIGGLDIAAAAGQVLNVGLGVANLGVGLANLGLSRKILREVQQLAAQLNRVETRIAYLQDSVEEVLARTASIEIKVEEQHLRAALDHLIARSVTAHDVDLVELTRIGADLVKFEETLPKPLLYGSNATLRLSTDVRDKIELVYRLIRGSRQQTLAHYNTAVAAGYPELVVTEADIQQRFNFRPSIPQLLVAYAELTAREQERPRSHYEAISRSIDAELFGVRGSSVFSAWEADPATAEIVVEALAPIIAPHETDAVAANGMLGDYLVAWESTDAAMLTNLKNEVTLRTSSMLWEPLTSHAAGLGDSLTNEGVVLDIDRARQEVRQIETTTRHE